MLSQSPKSGAHSPGKRIKVIGVGGGGIRAVGLMMGPSMKDVEFICVHSDAQVLSRSKAHRTFLMGTSGRALTRASYAREVAELSADDLRPIVSSADLVILIACMAGSVGTGATVVISRLARQLGALTVAVVSMPFASFETSVRVAIADAGLNLLEVEADAVIAISNDTVCNLIECECTLEECIAQANSLMARTVRSLIGMVTNPGSYGLGICGVRTALAMSGKALMGTATASGLGRARSAALQAIACPLFEGEALSSAKRVMVLIEAAAAPLQAYEYLKIRNIVMAAASPEAVLTIGTALGEDSYGQLRVTIIGSAMTRTWITKKNAHGVSKLYLPYLLQR